MAKISTILTEKTEDHLKVMGKQIRNARIRRNMPAEELAEKSGVSISTIWAIEKGAPTVSVGKIAAVLSVLKLDKDFEKIAADDTQGRKLQDKNLPQRARKPKKGNTNKNKTKVKKVSVKPKQKT